MRSARLTSLTKFTKIYTGKSKIIKVRDEKGKNAMDTKEIQRMVRIYFNNLH